MPQFTNKRVPDVILDTDHAPKRPLTPDDLLSGFQASVQAELTALKTRMTSAEAELGLAHQKIDELKAENIQLRQENIHLRQVCDEQQDLLVSKDNQIERLHRRLNAPTIVLLGVPESESDASVIATVVNNAKLPPSAVQKVDTYNQVRFVHMVSGDAAHEVLRAQGDIMENTNWRVERRLTKLQQGERKERRGLFDELKRLGARPRWMGSDIKVYTVDGLENWPASKPAFHWDASRGVPSTRAAKDKGSHPGRTRAHRDSPRIPARGHASRPPPLTPGHPLPPPPPRGPAHLPSPAASEPHVSAIGTAPTTHA